MLARGEVHDPGIGFITLTRVKVSADLQVARVFYTTLGDRRRGARPHARSSGPRRSSGARSAAGCGCARVPEIEFRFDEAIAHQDRIEQILRDLHEEEAARSADAAAAESAPARSHAPIPERPG